MDVDFLIPYLVLGVALPLDPCKALWMHLPFWFRGQSLWMALKKQFDSSRLENGWTILEKGPERASHPRYHTISVQRPSLHYFFTCTERPGIVTQPGMQDYSIEFFVRDNDDRPLRVCVLSLDFRCCDMMYEPMYRFMSGKEKLMQTSSWLGNGAEIQQLWLETLRERLWWLAIANQIYAILESQHWSRSRMDTVFQLQDSHHSENKSLFKLMDDAFTRIWKNNAGIVVVVGNHYVKIGKIITDFFPENVLFFNTHFQTTSYGGCHWIYWHEDNRKNRQEWLDCIEKELRKYMPNRWSDRRGEN